MLTEGMIITERYQIVGKIGTGGMSDVYKAKDTTLGRFVAIKVLKQEYSEDINFVTKFRTEAQAAAGLEHPNIVNIYDVGSDKGLHYIVMEYVEGITLKTYIEKKGQLSYKETVSIAIQVGRGIEAAHSKSVIHRDIKPQNIIISKDGKVKVTDFGIARAATSNTIHSDVMGSVHYASPEQARNGFVDGRSDIYSLGIVMYEMVTGRVPFDGDSTVAVAIQHLQEEMVAPSTYAPDLPVSVEKIILKCTQKNADRRYDSITALLTDLRKALVTPNEDFVVIAPITSQEKTRVIKPDELSQIKKETGTISAKEIREAEIDEDALDAPDDDDDDDALVGAYDDPDSDALEDEEINPTLEKVLTGIGIGFAVVIIILIIVLLVNLFGNFNSASRDTEDTETETETEYETEYETEDVEGDIEVPVLTNITYEQAKELLEGMGLFISENGTESSDDISEGKIIRQDIDAGTKVSANTTVGVTVSSGSGSVDIVDVVGLTEADALKKIQSAGFTPKKEYSYSDTVTEGTVISQSPESSAKGKEGDTVTITISQGVEMVSVPEVTTPWQAEGTAKEKLAASGLNVKVVTEYSDYVSEGVVMGQDPVSGTKVNKGSEVTLTVSAGPAPVTTYKFSATITSPTNLPSGATLTSADIVLKDTSGNTLASWAGQPASAFSGSGLAISKTGLTVSSGKIVITWNYTQDVTEDGETTKKPGSGNQEQDVSFTKEN